MTDPLVSTAWLADHLGDPNLRIVDASWWMPAENRSGHAEFLEAHIPGAIFFDIDAIADRTMDLPHMLPSPEAFAEAAGALGLSREATVVVYDTFGVRASARACGSSAPTTLGISAVLNRGLPGSSRSGENATQKSRPACSPLRSRRGVMTSRVVPG